MVIMLLRSVIIYVCCFAVIRLMGKRQIGEMQPFEFVVTLIIADLACIPMAELSVPLLHGVVPILTLLIVHFLICFLSRKFMGLRYLLTGKPVIVMSPKGIDYNQLKALNMTLDDLMELVRGCSVFNLSEVLYAIIETNGNLSVIKKAEAEQATRDDLKVKVSQNSLPINLVMDGKLMKENMLIAGVDNQFVYDCVERSQIKNEKEVLILTLDSNGEVFIQDKGATVCLSFQTDYKGDGNWWDVGLLYYA